MKSTVVRPSQSRAGGTRTPNHRFWRPVLYQLSYCPPAPGAEGVEDSSASRTDSWRGPRAGLGQDLRRSAIGGRSVERGSHGGEPGPRAPLLWWHPRRRRHHRSPRRTRDADPRASTGSRAAPKPPRWRQASGSTAPAPAPGTGYEGDATLGAFDDTGRARPGSADTIRRGAAPEEQPVCHPRASPGAGARPRHTARADLLAEPWLPEPWPAKLHSAAARRSRRRLRPR